MEPRWYQGTEAARLLVLCRNDCLVSLIYLCLLFVVLTSHCVQYSYSLAHSKESVGRCGAPVTQSGDYPF